VTYSFVARDPETGQLGVAVQTRAFGVGRAVPWAEAGVAAIATQSFTDMAYGVLGLELLRAGKAPADALAGLVAADPDRDFRQVGFVDAEGRSAAHTGAACIAEAGHVTGDGWTAQANMMRSAAVWPAMAEAYAAASGTLAQRLLAALDAAEDAGGDFRGRQAAAILVVEGERGDRPWEQRVSDVRVDDHAEPVAELHRLLAKEEAYQRLNRLSLGDPGEEDAFDEARAAGIAEVELTSFAARLAWKAADYAELERRAKPLVDAEARWSGWVAALVARPYEE
jgi:uncharacterized Ntn-hydrolase superfamily protein